MDASEVLRTTRAMRRLKPDPIPDDVVYRILDTAVRAPCGGNEQTWRFVVVRDRATIGELAPLYRAGLEALYGRSGAGLPSDQARRNFASAWYLADHFDAVPVCVFGYRRSSDPQWDGATMYPALWQLCLAARAEGVGTTMTTILAGPAVAARVDRLLGVPTDEDWRQFGMVPMGYPLGRWGTPPRRGPSQVAFADRWDRPLRLTSPADPVEMKR